ncbi:MAG: polyamine ABC transporter permease subunit [Candidatus Improbicoccus devescovinae]|nr:MAG: polyamine ABC transporter permease subunit [Candidatus Improbicoccus devescovinae]
MFIFSLTPLALIMFFSLVNSKNEFTLENFINAFDFSSVFLRSLNLSIISTIICLIFSYPAAFIISKFSNRSQVITMTLIVLPMWISMLLRTYAWMTILENNGLINLLLSKLGISQIEFLNKTGTVIFGMIYNFFPYMVLPIYTSLTKTNKSIVESAQDLGANKFDVFRKIIFPLSLPGVFSGVTIVFVQAISTFIISKMLGGVRNILIGELIEMRLLGSSYNLNAGSALSVVFIILVMTTIGIINIKH